MNIVLNVWRQESPGSDGRFVAFPLSDVDPAWMLLDALDMLNERLVAGGERPIAFDSDCREGICGACGVVVNGRAHGGSPLATTCELSIRAALASGARPRHGAGVITLAHGLGGAFEFICDAEHVPV